MSVFLQQILCTEQFQFRKKLKMQALFCLPGYLCTILCLGSQSCSVFIFVERKKCPAVANALSIKSLSVMADYEGLTLIYFRASFHYQSSGEMPEHKTSIAPLHLAGSSKRLLTMGFDWHCHHRRVQYTISNFQ